MNVILKQDHKDLGKKGQVVKVSDGYAKNYLIPRGIAIEATAGQLKDIENKQQAADEKKQRKLAEARALADSIKEKMVVVRLKAGSEGRLFGSVSSEKIAEAIKTQLHYDIDKKNLVIKEPIKSVGVYMIDAKLYPTVSCKIRVKVESD